MGSNYEFGVKNVSHKKQQPVTFLLDTSQTLSTKGLPMAIL